MAAKDQSAKVVLENLKDQIKKSVRDQLNSKDKTLESCKNCADLEDTNNHLYAMVDSLVNTVKTQAKVNLSFKFFKIPIINIFLFPVYGRHVQVH